MTAKQGVVEKMLMKDRAIMEVPPPNWEPLPRNKVWRCYYYDDVDVGVVLKVINYK